MKLKKNEKWIMKKYNVNGVEFFDWKGKPYNEQCILMVDTFDEIKKWLNIK